MSAREEIRRELVAMPTGKFRCVWCGRPFDQGDKVISIDDLVLVCSVACEMRVDRAVELYADLRLLIEHRSRL